MALLAVIPSLSAQDAAAPVFERDVLPIFSTYCFTCHGKSSPELGLDLRSAANTLRGSFNGAVVKKGDAEGSRLYQKVAKHQMPPPAFEVTLPDEAIATIRAWIEHGALSAEKEKQIPEQAQHQLSRFDKEILPIFERRCVACHGAENPQSGLDLRSLASALKGGAHGPIIEEGFSDKSILIRQLQRGAMPPPGVGEPLSKGQIALIRDWIDRGNFADYVELPTDLDRAFTRAEAPKITAEERSFWAFQPPVAAPVPAVQARNRAKTPIDSFLLAALEERGLAYSSQASKQTLLRRAYFDLWGLPPTVEQTAEFLNDSRPDAYERLIDRLLASPRYGERWGRYWLDAAGYVDTTGKDFQPDRAELHPGMWRYRDYVIESFNKDKPWDRFLTEQLAGDELVDWRKAEAFTPEIVESLVATGYLRTILDVTDEDISDRPSDRYDALFGLLDKVSSSVLGLTLSCSRCHSHKFDPVPQRDYYRFLSLFTTAYNPSDWVQPKKRLMYTVSKKELEEIEKHNKAVDEEVAKIAGQIDRIRAPYREKILARKLEKVPEPVRADTALAVETEAKRRSEVQKYLVQKFGALIRIETQEIDEAVTGAPKDELLALEKRKQTWDGYRRRLEQVQALWDNGEIPAIRLLQRGSVEAPGPRVTPGFLSVLCAPNQDCAATPSDKRVGETSGFRLALAEWLTSPEHPLTARVIVNRIWQQHFGTGIVATPDNFGATGSPPSHPKLLDWLAADFMKHGWKAKRLHKMIMLSAAYQQSSRRMDNPQGERTAAEDPENRLLWRMPLRRLDAEALRDSTLAVAGKLNPKMGGPPVDLDVRPDGVQIIAKEVGEEEANRRSVYLLSRRNYPLSLMAVFDFPIMENACARRVNSATPLQSLTLMNGEFVSESAGQVAKRLLAGLESRPAPEELAGTAYRLLFARPPTAQEVRFAVEHLQAQQEMHARANFPPQTAFEKSVGSLAHMLMISNEFLYVD